MEFGIHTIDDFEVKGKTVLCRVDINQPMDKTNHRLESINRIQACIPTIKELSQKGSRLVLLAHQGSDIEYQNYDTTAPHAEVLSRLLGKKVDFIADVCGPAAQEKIATLKDGEILLLDNVRFLAEEQTLFETKLKLSFEKQAQTLLVRKLAPLADLYVCDAFAAAHRAQPSLCGLEQVLPSAMGRLFEKEYVTISRIMEEPIHPGVFVLGGSKVEDAFLMMQTVLEKGVADRILTGGLTANILLAGRGEDIGSGSMALIQKMNYGNLIKKAAALLEQYADQIVLPVDLACLEEGRRREYMIGEAFLDGTAVDIGSNTAEQYEDIIRQAASVFVNGPMGIFEKGETAYGTRKIWEALAETKAFTVAGGGDTVSAAEKFQVKDAFSYVCTGGGALIRFLSGEELPVVRALRDSALRLGIGA